MSDSADAERLLQVSAALRRAGASFALLHGSRAPAPIAAIPTSPSPRGGVATHPHHSTSTCRPGSISARSATSSVGGVMMTSARSSDCSASPSTARVPASRSPDDGPAEGADRWPFPPDGLVEAVRRGYLHAG
ncbi:MAG: hypothetical protein H0V10_15795 [Geodermatophilaceae bacterium]|nr:hypothetical protein [Geodermatophilaceae bacterium]